jgi:glycosyltransferase involved in cell wall biosynthesis
MQVIKEYKVRKEVYLIPTGVDPRIFQRKESEVSEFRSHMETLFPALTGKRILLFAGRIAKEKNISFLLEILPEIRKEHPDVVLLVVGNGPDLYDLKEESEKLKIADSCIFPGYLARKDLALTYALSDIFVFPSLTETQGMVTIEAMISGIPVVAIGEMGTLEVMHGDNGGFMVKNDKGEFTARVLELLDDDELYKRKVEEAKEHAKSWTIDAMAVKLQKVYKNAIDAWPNKHNS